MHWGHGIVNASAASRAALPTTAQSGQISTASSGSGTLDATRDGMYVTDGGVDLTGQQDIFGHAFSSTAMATLQPQAAAWSGGTWNGSRWSGAGWTGSRWSSASWTG